MPDLLIYGASDDCVELQGYIDEEFYVNADDKKALILTDPDGTSLWVTLTFGDGWSIAVEARDENYPSWPLRFLERPDRPGDPALLLTVPEGTMLDEVEA